MGSLAAAAKVEAAHQYRDVNQSLSDIVARADDEGNDGSAGEEDSSLMYA